MNMSRMLISRAITPVKDAERPVPRAVGEPALPNAFKLGQSEVVVTRVTSVWKGFGDCTHGSTERYLRKHGYRLEMANGEQWTVYFERQPRHPKRATARWYLYTVG